MTCARNGRSWFAWAFILFIPLLILSTPAIAQLPVALDEDGKPTLSGLIDRVTPAVVNISVTSTTTIQANPLFDDPFFRRFFDFREMPDQMMPRQSVGSGVIVDAERGYVVTNHHVVANADEIMVTLQDRRRVSAELVGSDEGTDVALLQIDAGNLAELQLANSSDLEVGDFVVAVGNPFGLGQTVTSGIVSALGRSGLNIEGYEDFIQTDASINPGNSGGALIDLDGRLVGVNTAIIAPSGGNVGIGFAVPANMVQAVMDQLLEYGEVRRGRLGIFIQDLTPELANALDLDVDEGAIVSQVEPGSAAEQADIRAGDIVTAVDDQSVSGSTALRNLIGLTRAGETVRITLIRDGRERVVEAQVGEATETISTTGSSLPKLSGAEFRPIGRDHPSYGELEGVLVANVEQDSPAWRNGLRAGDIISAVNRQPVRTVNDLSSAVEAAGRTFALDILRDGARIFLVIQ